MEFACSVYFLEFIGAFSIFSFLRFKFRKRECFGEIGRRCGVFREFSLVVFGVVRVRRWVVGRFDSVVVGSFRVRRVCL